MGAGRFRGMEDLGRREGGLRWAGGQQVAKHWSRARWLPPRKGREESGKGWQQQIGSIGEGSEGSEGSLLSG